jgi:hypothetical protein
MKRAENLASHLGKVYFRRILTRYNQDVKVFGKSVLMSSEELFQPTFYSISPYCSLMDSLADGHC